MLDEATGEHHLFVSEFAGPNGTSCGASSWETNSMAVHSVSKSGLHGPYVKKDVAVGHVHQRSLFHCNAARLPPHPPA